MTRIVSLAFCVLLVVAAAVVHGRTTHRWSALQPDAARAKAMHEVVLSLGAKGVEEVPSDMPVKEKSTCTCRRYLSPTGGLPLTVSLTSGPTGAVSTHTPDVCYPSSGYKTAREPKRETVDLPGGGTATYMVAEYEKKTATTVDRHRIRWAWTTDGQWTAPTGSARVAYFGAPELYKLYIVTPVSADSTDPLDTSDSPAVKAAVAEAFAQYGRVFSR